MRTDSPVSTKDQDILNRYPFAVDLIKGLLANFENGQDSIVIGLNGEWGSGKSSLLEFIKKEFESQTHDEQFRNYLFDFNPWRISSQEDLQRQFLQELGIILGNYSIAQEQLKKDFKKFADVAGKANKSNPEPISKFSIGTVASIIKNFTKETTLIGLKHEVDERLKDNNIKMFILIDDIDRLPPKEITEIFQLIKLNANFKNTYFIIAFDKGIVINALSNEYKFDGEKYIEKIVQIDYTIPSIPQEEISKIFSEEINQIIGKLNLDIGLDEIGNLWDKHLKHYFSTIRHIYRFCNAIELRLPVISSDISLDDFILIETLRVNDFKIYEWIYKNYEKLTLARKSEISMFLVGSGDKSENINDDIKKLIKDSEELRGVSEETHKLLLELFSLKSNTSYETLKEELNKNKRIASPDYFEQYFSFKILSINVPDEDYNKFINKDEDSRKTILDHYKNKNLIHKFLKGLVYKIQKSSDKNLFNTYYNELLDYCDKYLIDFTTEYFEQNGWFVIASFLIDISHEYEKDEGFKLLFKSLYIENISYSRYLILTFLRNRVVLNNNYRVVASIPEDIIDKNKTKILNRHKELLFHYVETLTKNTYEFDEYTVSQLLRTLWEVNKEKYESEIKLFTEVDANIILVFKYSLTMLTRSGKEKYAYLLSNNNHIMPTMNIDRIDKMLNKINREKYEGANKEFLDLFYILKEKGFDETRFYTIDGNEVRQ